MSSTSISQGTYYNYGQTWYNRARRALHKVGVNLPLKGKRLGSGASADVWAAGKTRVVKLTCDEDDVRMAYAVMQTPRKYKHLVRVYNVLHLHDDTWCIVAERLKELPKKLRYSWKTPMCAITWKWDHSGTPPSRSVNYRAVRAITKDLKKLGCTRAGDLHEKNVMIRPRTKEYVLADLGFTTSPLPLPQRA